MIYDPRLLNTIRRMLNKPMNQLLDTALTLSRMDCNAGAIKQLGVLISNLFQHLNTRPQTALHSYPSTLNTKQSKDNTHQHRNAAINSSLSTPSHIISQW